MKNHLWLVGSCLGCLALAGGAGSADARPPCPNRTSAPALGQTAPVYGHHAYRGELRELKRQIKKVRREARRLKRQLRRATQRRWAARQRTPRTTNHAHRRGWANRRADHQVSVHSQRFGRRAHRRR